MIRVSKLMELGRQLTAESGIPPLIAVGVIYMLTKSNYKLINQLAIVDNATISRNLRICSSNTDCDYCAKSPSVHFNDSIHRHLEEIENLCKCINR